MSTVTETNRPLFETLRRLVRRPAPATEPLEKCELCGAPLGREHDHLIELERRRLMCACQACALLFSDPNGTRFRCVPRRVERLENFQISEAQWDSLLIPINLAFFYYRSPDRSVHCFYPSPAGATESMLEFEAWQELVTANPMLGGLSSDVEALLVNRIGKDQCCYRISIDKCYELVGLIRMQWRGLSGGAKVWEEIKLFFENLRKRSQESCGHAS
jgi:hypothetical protein